MGKRCLGCGVVLNDRNAYPHPRTSDGLQSRCKDCQLERQRKKRSSRKESKGIRSVVVCRIVDTGVLLTYNRERQLVDITGPKGEVEIGRYWARTFGRESREKVKRKKFYIRVLHVGLRLWKEVTEELEVIDDAVDRD